MSETKALSYLRLGRSGFVSVKGYAPFAEFQSLPLFVTCLILSIQAGITVPA